MSKGIIMRGSLIIILNLICAFRSYALDISRSLPFIGEPEDQWFVVLDNSEEKIYRANLQRGPNQLTIFVSDDGVSENALLSGVVIFAGGKVI